MANSGDSVEDVLSLDPRHVQRLRQACPDLDDWPRSWHIDPADIPVGQQIVEVLTPFLLHLLDQGLAKATVRRHRDNLWTLGGELIRCRYDDEALAHKDVRDALQHLIEGDGGPLMWPRITELEQGSLDATGRKLDRFWHESAAGETPGSGNVPPPERHLNCVGRPTRVPQSAPQSCPRRRVIGACDEPTGRRGGQLVSKAQEG